MTSLTNAVIAAQCRELKLPSIGARWESMEQEAVRNALSHSGYLSALFEHELDDRAQRRAQRRIASARFPAIKRLTDFDFAEAPTISAAQIAQLANCEYVGKAENILFVGGNGTGKTMLATALGVAACEQGRSVRFTTVAALVNELLEERDERTLSRVVSRWSRFDLLIAYELGYVTLPPTGAELLFQILAQRSEAGSVIITTNLPFSKAHMFRRTRARWRRKSTGFRWRFRAADDCGGYQRYQVVGPAVRFLGGDLGAAVSADEVGTVLAVKSAAAAATPCVGMQSGARHVVGMKDEQRGVVVDRVGALRHPRVGDAMAGQVVAGRGGL